LNWSAVDGAEKYDDDAKKSHDGDEASKLEI
jgi:hypothetical protein